jgi:hypothetical protein
MLLWATYIIGFLFGFFVLFIAAMRITRAMRNAHEHQSRIHSATESTAAELRRPSDDFHDQIWLPLCNQVAKLAAAKMQRPLSSDERRMVWRGRSQLVLELLLKELTSASPGEAIALLRNAPTGMDRPDPTGWCERP